MPINNTSKKRQLWSWLIVSPLFSLKKEKLDRLEPEYPYLCQQTDYYEYG